MTPSSILQRTFCHLPGIGLKTERHFWERGIQSWDDLAAMEHSPRATPKVRRAARAIRDSSRQLAAANAEYFFERLPASQQWRAFGDFRQGVAYLDIETTGLGNFDDYITTIALYDGRSVRVYVHGRNLGKFIGDIRDYTLLVTYNGKTFDVPFIERQFGIRLPKAHIDLRYVLAALGYKGGLKGCEKQVGLARDLLQGLDGYFAVLLWQEYLRTRSEPVLETLLAYNVADVLSLETLLAHAVNRHLERTPFARECAVGLPRCLANPLTAHRSVIDAVKRRYRFR